MAKKATKKTQAKKKSARRKVDPVIVEIVRNGVLAVTEEMKTNLMRTAYNMIIYEALDFTTGLFTPEGETVPPETFTSSLWLVTVAVSLFAALLIVTG